MTQKPTIALVAHDSCKPALLALARDYESDLKDCELVATRHTGYMLASHTKLQPTRTLESGPLGGDLELASLVVNGGIDALIFLCDTTQTHPHQSDINALLRISTLYDIPLATNITTAKLVLSSNLVKTAQQSKEFSHAESPAHVH